MFCSAGFALLYRIVVVVLHFLAADSVRFHIYIHVSVSAGVAFACFFYRSCFFAYVFYASCKQCYCVLCSIYLLCQQRKRILRFKYVFRGFVIEK